MVIHHWSLSFALPVVSNRDSSLQGAPSSSIRVFLWTERFVGHEFGVLAHMAQNCHDITSSCISYIVLVCLGDKGIQPRNPMERTFLSPRNGLKIFDANGAFRCCNYAQHDRTPQISGSETRQVSSYKRKNIQVLKDFNQRK